MCGRNLKNGGRSSSRGFRLLVVCVLLSLFAASPLLAADWLFLGSKGAKESAHTESVQVILAQEAEAVPAVETVSQPEVLPEPTTPQSASSQSKSDEILVASQTAIETAETALQKSEEALQKLEIALEGSKNSQENLELISEVRASLTGDMLSSLNVLEVNNTRQADEIAYTQGRLDKETGTKFFAKVNGIVGFKDSKPTWGVGTSIGLRVGSGFLIETGVNYMVGDFVSKPSLEFDLDNLQIVAGIGWEW